MKKSNKKLVFAWIVFTILLVASAIFYDPKLDQETRGTMILVWCFPTFIGLVVYCANEIHEA